MPYDVNADDTQEFAPIPADSHAAAPQSRFGWLRGAARPRTRYIAAGIATLGMAAVLSIVAAHPGGPRPQSDTTASDTAVTGTLAPAPAPSASTPAPVAAKPAPTATATPKPSTSAEPTRAVKPKTTSKAKPKATSKAKPKATSKPKPKTSSKAKSDAARKAAGAARKAKKAVAAAWVAPMHGYRMTSCYGPRWGRMHQGIDFAVSAGAPIYAAAAGKVVSAGWNAGGYGNMIIIQHGPHLFTLYGHSSKLLVHVGQKVKAGQQISREGSTGHVTGPHLHFEVWNAMWHRIEPAHFLRAHGVSLPRC